MESRRKRFPDGLGIQVQDIRVVDWEWVKELIGHLDVLVLDPPWSL